MRTRRNRLATLLLAALLLVSKSVSGIEPDEPGPFLVDAGVSPLFQRALVFAADLLTKPGCQEVLTDFRDGRGRTLQENLDEWDLTPTGYLERIRFTPGRDVNLCNNSRVLASTSPGSRVVFVCGMRFQSLQLRDQRSSAYTLIHEMLHTLGLGENPPASQEITERVRARCR